MASKIKGLQMWCKKMTEGYPHVDITNFTTAWRDGMAFCALIHRFRPDLIDFDSLSPDNVFDNCKMAFELAEKELSIPAFLEASDMVRLKVPDKLSIITYVSQYYNYLHALPQLGGPGVKSKVSIKTSAGTKRPPDVDTSQAPSTKKLTSEAAKENSAPAAQEPLGNRCNICQKQVYLLERHMDEGKLYHRSCFRHSELSPTNKVYSKSPFLSPSLHSEHASHLSTDAKAGHGDGNHEEKKVDSVLTPTRAPLDTKVSSLKPADIKKQEAAGMKHSLAEPDREDSKKFKLQSSNATVKSAFKEKLEGLKAKYTRSNENNFTKSNESNFTKSNENNLPLSSKEAKKLEKRKEEILASEKLSEASVKGSKRSMPLIFQQKDTEAKAGSAQSVSAIHPVQISRTQRDISSNSDIQSKDRTKPEIGPFNDQRKLRDANTAVSLEPNKFLPTAKPRSYNPKSDHDESPNKYDPHQSEKVLVKDTTPKPAPRRLFNDTADKKLALERPNHLAISERSEQITRVETPDSSSPPPLPITLPPASHVTHLSPVSDAKVTTHSNSTIPTQVVIKETTEAIRNDHIQSRSSLKDNDRTSENRWSIPMSVNSPAVFVNIADKKDEDHVKSGLLSSLAKVRNRTFSTPGTSQNLSTPSSPASPIDNKALPVKSHKSEQTPVSNITVSKLKEDKSQLENKSKEKTDKFSINSSFLKVSDETSKTGISKSTNLTSFGALDHSKNDDMVTSQPNSSNKNIFKSETPDVKPLVSILKNGLKKLVGTEKQEDNTKKQDAAKMVNMKTSKNEKNHWAQTPADKPDKVMMNDNKTSVTSTDTKKSTFHISESKSSNEEKMKLNKLANNEKLVSSNMVDTTPARPSRGKIGTMDNQIHREPIESQEINTQKSISTDDNIPQWKKDIEEKRRKLREEIVKAELSSTRSKYTSSHSDRPKSVDLTDLFREKELSKVQPNFELQTTHRKSAESLEKDKENDFGQVLDVKAKLPKPKAVEPVSTGGKLEWQLEAEKKMAALAAFDKKATKPETSIVQKIDSSLPQVSKSTMNHTEEHLKTNKEQVTLDRKDKTNKDTVKTENPEPEFVASKSKLRIVDTNTNHLLHKADDHSNIGPQENGFKEDFREKLKHLKHVGVDLNSDVVSARDMSTLPANLNNNNVPDLKNSDMLHITRLNQNVQVNINSLKEIQNKDESKLKTGKEKIQQNSYQDTKPTQSELDIKTKSSPKVKRKITVLGRNKQGSIDSPPASPHMKKIQVGTKFDFDKSLESSLTDSTAQLSINDIRTPPPRPPPISIMKSPQHISVLELQQQLLDIDSRLTDLEIRGRDLEDSIRKVCASDDAEDDDLMMEWFSLVTEKNELVRQEADLVYISREQELEDEQEKIESQLRYLMSLPEHTKSPVEKKEEDYLITRKLQLVEQRNFIVDSMDEDRLRYEEEDRNIRGVLEERGLLKDESGMSRALKGKKIARSIFYT